jgi:hypothetical protein
MIKKRKQTKQNRCKFVCLMCVRVCDRQKKRKIFQEKTKSNRTRQPPQINKLKNTPEGRINEDNI